jgi:hypothetical protein
VIGNLSGPVAAVSALTLAVTLAGCGGESGAHPAGGTSTPASAEIPKKPLGVGRQRLDPGTYVLDLASRDHSGTGPPHVPRIAITLPNGWFNYDGWAMSKGRPLPPPIFVTFWDVARVYPTPCKWAGLALVDPGPGVDGLASALAKQPLRNATVPSDVILAGFRGKYLEWSVPTDIAFDEARKDKALFPDCDEETFQSWTANGWSGDRYQQTPGQVDRIWILDVDGQRLVVDASYLPEATPSDRHELERVVNSIRFLGSRS